MKKLIIVLAHPRTGSSMLMQTLRLLNVKVIGQFEREDLPQHANPKGYYEDKKILKKGLTLEAIDKIEKNESETLAVKIALSGMIQEDRVGQWRYMAEKGAIVFMPIRSPLEIASSRMVFKASYDNITRFVMISSFLRDYPLHLKSLAKIFLTETPELLSNIHTINHQTAYHKPSQYIQKIIDVAQLSVTEKAVSNALKNIDPSLYRYKQDSFDDELWQWYRNSGTKPFYDTLLTQENPWKIINDMIPDWQRGG